MPQLAAGWRRSNVTVGEHVPPDFFRVPGLVREYCLDAQARLASGSDAGNEALLETLAFAEGRLLFIHPFADFNGRVTRVWLREILRRLDLPPVQLAPDEKPARDEYLNALRAARCGPRRLAAVDGSLAQALRGAGRFLNGIVQPATDLGKQLYERVAKLGEHWANVGDKLGKAVDAYNSATSTLESRCGFGAAAAGAEGRAEGD